MQGYKITNAGVSVYTKALIAQGWEPCRTVTQLQAVASKDFPEDNRELHYVGPKMPVSWLKQVLGTIKQFPNDEVGFLLYINPQTDDWYVDVSTQHGGAAAVQFEHKEAPKGYMWIGTIHTHPEMPAFWSNTDVRDQTMRGGLHIVFGLSKGKPSSELISLFGINAGQTRVEPADIYEEILDYTQDYEPNDEWIKTIKEKQTMTVDTSYTDFFKPAIDKEYSDNWGDLPDHEFEQLLKKTASQWQNKWDEDEVAMRDVIAGSTLCDLLMDITKECKDKKDIPNWIKTKRPDVYRTLQLFHLA